MEMKEQNENRLVYETDFVLYIFRPENILIVIAFVVFFIGSIPSGPTFRIPFWWIFVFIAVFVWAIVNNEIIFDCTIDKESEVILAKVRAAWRLGIPRIIKISFHEVNNLVLQKTGKWDPKLYLQLESKTISFAGKGTAQLAEEISDFLEVPLYIELESERVTRLPFKANAEDVGISATPCPKCGAPLPRIYPGLNNVKCTHCGMTMLLEWNEKLTSFRSRPVN